MRVLLDARKLGDLGIGRYVEGLLGALAVRGDLELLAIVRADQAAGLPRGVAPILSTASHYSLNELFSVRDAVRRAAPDVFHAPHYVVPLAPPRATVVTIHDLMHLTRLEHRAPWKRAYAHVMLRRAVGAAARVITVSEAVKREITGFDARAEGKTSVVPSAVSPRFGNVGAGERQRVRKAHDLSRPYVLYLGNDKPHKNLDGLLEAFARLGRDDLDLVLAGGAPERSAARRARLRRFDPTRVRDLGRVSDTDIPPLLAEASALALPSFAEGFGLPALEAQAAGTPVVCSDRGGLTEAAGDAAVFVDPESADSIADGLRRVLSDEALRSELIAKGRTRAARSTWEAVAERTVALYREAASA